MAREPGLRRSSARTIAAAMAGYCLTMAVALAAPITYTFSGTMSGTLGATPFSGAAVTITGVGDTAAVVPGGGFFCNNLTSASFTISGAGSGTFISPLAITDDNGSATVDLGIGTCAGPPTPWIAILNAAQFNAYDLATPIGPLVVSPFGFSGAVPITSAGALTLTGNGLSGFQAALGRVLDIDDNGGYDALTDGLMVIRHLFGLTGLSVTSGAIGTGAVRSDPVVIATYLAGIHAQLDVDGNGASDALTDGLLIIRYLFGLRGSALIAGAVDPLGTRKTAPLIEAYILLLMP